MKRSSNVPAFLTKLWTLVEDDNTNEFICWSQGGNSFLVSDEQRFAKEILPKFFKHNNMASFVRQLNMYGFHKVMHIDTGVVKQERDGPVEFQHPYFKHGQDDLLENIKRKVSNTRPEDTKIHRDDVSKIFAGVHSVHSKQETTDARLATLERENKALWREIADLTQKHTHQQQLIKKLIHFMVNLVQKKHIINLKRKRPILMQDDGKMPKYNYQIYKDVCMEESSVSTLSSLRGSEISDDVFTCDTIANEAEATADNNEGSPRAYEQSDVEVVEEKTDGCSALSTEAEVNVRLAGTASSSPPPANKPSGLSHEDPLKMMDTILTENGAISKNINLLGKVDLMDYLDSIDCSLEDFQAKLCGKPFGVDFDLMEESMSFKESSAQDNTHKQLIQYTSLPMMAFIDGCTSPSEFDQGTSSRSTRSSRPNLQLLSSPSSPVEAEPALELLSDGSELKLPLSCALIRLEPLTEAQASEETIFHLSELSPAGLKADFPQLHSDTSVREEVPTKLLHHLK